MEVSLAGVEFGFEYPELVPVISATGAGESMPSWDYEAVRGIHLQGSKWMHLLVKAPLGTSSCKAVLGLVADVVVHNLRLPVLAIRDQKSAATQLVARLWGTATSDLALKQPETKA